MPGPTEWMRSFPNSELDTKSSALDVGELFFRRRLAAERADNFARDFGFLAAALRGMRFRVKPAGPGSRLANLQASLEVSHVPRQADLVAQNQIPARARRQDARLRDPCGRTLWSSATSWGSAQA